MRSVTALSTAFLMIVSSMAGCIEGLEDIADAIGCSDENASNYDPDATSGSDDLCLFLENEARFMAAMGDAMAADPSSYLLDSDSGVSGVEYSMSMSGDDPDSGMSVSMEMLSVIMVDLESQSMYNRSMISYMDMISIDSEMVWSGTDIMVTTSIGGPMASEVGESGTTSSISRDMSPDLEEVVRAASFGMTGMMGMEDLLMAGMLPDGDDHDDHERDDDEDCASNDEECGDGEDREEDDDESDFDWFDRNQDGFVEMGEIETALYEEPSFSREMADCIIDNVSPVFSDADENDDQKLDEYEFDGFDSWLEINFDIDEACGDSELPMDDMMPEGSSVSITQDDSGIQTMVMQTVDDTGDMTMWIRLHGDGSFHSYEMEMDDGESVMSMTFSYLTSEMVSIPEIDYTLDRTATPISVHVEPLMVCDDGELVPAWSVMDGWEDCGDGSDESFGDSGEEDGDGEADIDDMMEWGDEDWDGVLSFEEIFTAMTDVEDPDLTSNELLDLLEATVAFGWSGESEAGIDISFYWDREGDLWGTYNYDYTVDQDYTHIDFDSVDGVVMYSATSTVTNLYSDPPSGISDGDWVEFSVVFSDGDIEPYFEMGGENGMFGDSCYNMGDMIDCSAGMTVGMSFSEGISYDIEYESGFSKSGMVYEIQIIDGGVRCDYHNEYGAMCHSGGGGDSVHFTDMYGDITWEMSGEDDWLENSDPESTQWVDEFSSCDTWNSVNGGFGVLAELHEIECFFEEIEGYLIQHLDLESDDEDDDEICIWEDEHGVVHYDCEDSWEDYDFPMVMHAHVVDQVANAPIADFELRMLDCDEGDMDSEDDMEDDSDPIWDEC
ncbi:MAG: low-density lipoprotein receptor class A repeat-containing protein, partial [Candidatus Thalassarchaeaceae archaeon]